MIKFDATSLRSRVARRIFVVFLVCAFLPFGGLVLVSYHQVVTFFDQRNERQLRALAKLFGVDLFQKLTFLESELQIIASKVAASTEIPSEALLETIRTSPKEQWKAVSLIRSRGQQHRLFGQIESLPDFSTMDRRRLAAGKVLISVLESTQGRSARILMSVSVNPQGPETDILIGEISDVYLWGVNDTRLLPSYVQFCVQDQTGIMLVCSDSAFESFPSALREKMRRSALGDFEWTHQGHNYLASYWTIPLQFEFQDPGWTVILKTSKEGAFASVGELQRTFILAIVATAGLSILLAIFQIRKRLVPIEKLQEGTRRIAQQDFDFQVNIRSSDEFEDLAQSVNMMASQLGQQFHALSTKAEIDRAVLSLLDTGKIVETILNRLLEILPCTSASLTLLNSDDRKSNQVFILNGKNGFKSEGADSVRQTHEVHPANGDHKKNSAASGQMLRAEITRESDPITLRVAEAKIPLVFAEFEAKTLNLSFVERNGFRCIMAAPLIVKDEALGALAFYSDEAEKFADQEVDLLSGLTGQVAIAIYNSQLFERTKHHALELEKANKAKDEFLSVMSHELRTPLNVILGYQRMIQEKMLGDINADQARAIDTIGRHSNDLLAMIESIMEATKIEAGVVVIENQPVDLVNFLEDLKAHYLLPREKDLSVVWHYSVDLPALRTDAVKLKQILQNLITNAVKFTDRGHVDISARYLPEQEVVELTVADTGIGIPEESESAIFEMFRQLDSSKTREYGGMGLGLYIVKKLATLLGATIKVESQVGCGSAFTLTLPVSTEQKAPSAAAKFRGSMNTIQ